MKENPIKKYDYAILGSGCAGLSLAYYLSISSLNNKKVIIIDANIKNKNDRTWSYWTNKTPYFPFIQNHIWQETQLNFPQGQLNKVLKPFKYITIKGIEFYRGIQNHLSHFPNFESKQQRVIDIHKQGKEIFIETNKETFLADYVFNSIPNSSYIDNQYIHLHQYFFGYFLKTEKGSFKKTRFTMMDFKAPQNGEGRFFYILPFDEKNALVEFTVFSKKPLTNKDAQDALDQYISESLKITNYQIKQVERGMIPMTNYPFDKGDGKKIINIGTRAGLIKPSTGYTFKNIQEHSQHIVKLLEKGKIPVPKYKNQTRFQFYDTLLLHIMRKDGSNVRNIFYHLFKHNKAALVFKFLDEKTTIWEEMKLFMTLPWRPFLKALYNVYLYKNFFSDLPIFTQKRSMGNLDNA